MQQGVGPKDSLEGRELPDISRYGARRQVMAGLLSGDYGFGQALLCAPAGRGSASLDECLGLGKG